MGYRGCSLLNPTLILKYYFFALSRIIWNLCKMDFYAREGFGLWERKLKRNQSGRQLISLAKYIPTGGHNNLQFENGRQWWLKTFVAIKGPLKFSLGPLCLFLRSTQSIEEQIELSSAVWGVVLCQSKWWCKWLMYNKHPSHLPQLQFNFFDHFLPPFVNIC